MYIVGQVLYFVLSKKNQVYPMQVVEIITKKTLAGEEVSYILQAGPEKETKITFDQVDFCVSLINCHIVRLSDCQIVKLSEQLSNKN